MSSKTPKRVSIKSLAKSIDSKVILLYNYHIHWNFKLRGKCAFLEGICAQYDSLLACGGPVYGIPVQHIQHLTACMTDVYILQSIRPSKGKDSEILVLLLTLRSYYESLTKHNGHQKTSSCFCIIALIVALVYRFNSFTKINTNNTLALRCLFCAHSKVNIMQFIRSYPVFSSLLAKRIVYQKHCTERHNHYI